MILRRMNITGLLLLTLIPFYIPDLSAQTYVSEERETLRGLKGVLKGFSVLIEGLKEDITQAGLTESILQTDVELKLRKAGIRVLMKDDVSLLFIGRPHLYVSVHAIELKSRREFIYSVIVAFVQDVFLSRDLSIKSRGVTWTANTIVGISPDLRDVREAVSDLVDQFMNDYLAVNPK